MLPSLPLELVQHIIRLAISRVDEDYKLRYRHLRTFSLVCRAWAELAQRELYRHVQLHDTIAASKLIEQGKRLDPPYGSPPDATGRLQYLLHGARSAWLHFKEKFPRLMPQILVLLPGLTTMSISHMRVDLAMLSWAAELRTLSLRSVVLTMPHEVERSNWHFPRLTHLEIRDLYSRLFLEDGSQERGVVNAEFFLQPIALPKLSSLAFTWSHPYLSPLIRRLVPQLHRLYLRRTPSSDDDDDDDLPFPEFPRHIFEHLTSLQHLSLDLKYDDDIFALAVVPSSLLTLRLDGRRELTDVQLLERKYACLENLKELHLRSTPLVGKWWQLETEKLMRDRGTVVKEFEFQPHKPSKAVALWVEAVDEYDLRASGPGW